MSIPTVAETRGERLSIALGEFVTTVRTSLGKGLWLAATARAADDAKRRVAALGKPLVCSNIFTFESFAIAILERAGKPTVRRVPLRILIEDAARQLARTGKLDHFRRVIDTRGFMAGAEGLVQELDAAGVSTREFIKNADTPKLAACAELYAAVCQHADWIGNPLVRATELIKGVMPEPFGLIEQVFVDGFVKFAPVGWRLLGAMAPLVSLTVCLPDGEADREEAFAGVAETKDRLAKMAVRVTPSTSKSVTNRPAGLAHLERRLFASSGIPSPDGTGVELIEAPGEVGEARLVARRIRTLLADGVRPDDIVVTARELAYSLDLLEEVFDEYGLPIEFDADTAIARNPAVATLLRAIRLADEGFPFAGVTALLRSTYFRPEWPEGDGDTVRRAERLLRLLGVARSREAYLRAVSLWAETPPDGLEDEHAEQPRRLQKARLAAECRPFLERFFKHWDGIPDNATPAAFTAWTRDFARGIGLVGRADSDASDEAALRLFFAALDRQTGPAISKTAFLRLLTTIASSEPWTQSRPTAGRIRVLSAEDARHLDCEHLLILGLGESSFPKLGPPTSLLDDADRNVLAGAGLPLTDPGGRLADEQLLFLQLIARPRHGLVLSYPASDAKGQPRLAGSFLRAGMDCFTPDAVPTERQRMLIQGYSTRRAFSPAEARVQFAAAMGRSRGADGRHPGLDADLAQHLGWASEVATARFRTRDYGAFDGRLESPSALEEVRSRFGPDRVFSPTSLEAYVSCPFRFFLEHVLRLEELDEPSDEVEQTRRGAAYHRALARLHRGLDPALVRTTLPEQVNADLLTRLDEAVREYAERAPSPAAKKLWELEGRRLRRSAAKYREHWDDFLQPWRENGMALTPQLLEADFGLPAAGQPLTIQVGDVEVRVGGRIDRVDVADLRGELGFWIVDYKTGRSAHYPGTEISRLEKLQLSLYALAVERVFFPGRAVRPLGLAYWLVMDDGPKTVTPGSRSATAWLADEEKWAKFREQLEQWVANVVSRIRDGRFPLAPRSENCTDTCSFGQVCRINQSRNVGKVWDLTPPTDD